MKTSNALTLKEKISLLVIGLLIILGIIFMIIENKKEKEAKEQFRNSVIREIRKNPEGFEELVEELNRKERERGEDYDSDAELGQCTFGTDCW